MQRHILHVVAVVENLLRAVAVVIIDIEHGHFAARALHDVVRCNRGIVEKAVPAVEVAGGVVTWWSTQPVGSAFAAEHHVGGGECGVNRSPSSLIGAFSKRSGGLETPPTETGGDCGGLTRVAHLVAQVVAIKHVWHHFATVADNGLILAPRDREKVDQPFVVHRLDGVDTVIGRLTKREARVCLQ